MMSETNHIILGVGFIGNHLACRLVEKRQDVVLVGTGVTYEESNNVKVIKERIDDFSVLDRYLKENNVVYYLINTTSPIESEAAPCEDLKSNLALFVKYLTWVKNHPNIKTVFSSSGGTVYGDDVLIPITEDATTAPISFYGMGKLVCEDYLRMFGRKFGINYTIVRIANPYGPGQVFQRNQGIVPKIINCIENDEEFLVIGEGGMVRDYIYIDDLIDALLECAQSSNVNGEIINIGSGEGLSILEVIDTVEQVYSKKIQIRYLPPRLGDVVANVLSVEKINKLTQWSAKLSFKEGVSKIK